ncbi:MAG: hypothetical protein DI551_02315 [Micavibrio aeruginosavorus]|uniref:Uncharacterized protein n=1 Tax=Micavibrio aeruginosavorus TaxID=349221 RepID=A0A2W5Q9G5_9BACT|nr:MAG: hypothetical protein DI551_02315 [Micavibrio aeruginosavorus]
MAENKVISINDSIVQAQQCDVTADDILNERDLELAHMLWNNQTMEAANDVRLIKHERALEKFSKKAA